MSFDDLKNKPSKRAYITQCERTGQYCWSTSLVKDEFSGMMVHKDDTFKKSPAEKPYSIPQEKDPQSYYQTNPGLLPFHYYLLRDSSGNVIGIFGGNYSTYEPFTQANSTQVAYYVPTMSNYAYTVYLPTHVGLALGTVTASVTSGASFRYSTVVTASNLVQAADEIIFLNPSNGALTIADTSILTADNSPLVATIQATTQDISALSVTATVTLTVIQTLPPVFTSATSFAITDTTTTVGTVTTTDPQSFTVTYSITGGINAALFAINSSTGALTFLTTPSVGLTQVIIQATNGYASSTQQIGVTVSHAFVPTDVSGLKLWLDAQNFGSITQSGGVVSNWADLSSNATNMTSPSGKRPAYNASGIGGLPAVQFNIGSDQGKYMVSDQSASYWAFLHAASGGSTIFIVVKNDADSGVNSDRPMLDNTASGSFASGLRFALSRQSSANSIRSQHRSVANILSTASYNIDATLVNTKIINEAYSYGGSPRATIYEGNVSQITSTDSGTSSGGNPDNTMYIATNFGNFGVANSICFRGGIGAILIYDSLLSTVNRTAVYNYLKAEWGL